MVGRQTAFVELGIMDAVGTVLARVVVDDAVVEHELLIEALRLREGEPRAESPAAADLPVVVAAEGVGGQQIDGVTAVVVRVVGLQLVGALHVAEGVGGPEVETVEVEGGADIEARGEALLDDVVFAQVFGLVVSAGGVVVVVVEVAVDVVAVGVEQLVEVFEVHLGIEGDEVGEVVFGTDDEVLGFLHARGHLVAQERRGQSEVGTAGQEAGEEVDDVVVGACVEEYLAVESAGHLEAQLVGGIVFGGDARLQLCAGEGGVVDEAHPWVEQPFVGGELVGGVQRQVGRGDMLRDPLGVVVVEAVVGVVALDGETVAETVGTDEVRHLQGGVEAADGTVLVFPRAVVEGDVVVAVGHGAFQDGRRAGDEHEVGAQPIVAPVVVGDGLIVAYRVVEVEAEEADLAAGARVGRNLAVEVEKVEGQAAVDVGVEQLGGLGEVGVLGGEQVGDGGLGGGGLLLDRTFQDEVGAEGVDAYLAGVVAFVAVARGDVHHRRHAAAVFGTEAAGVDVGVEDDVGLEDGVESYAVEGVVDNHAVQQAEVLYHRAAAYVELAALVAGRVDARQHLHVLRYVGRAADGGHLLYLAGGELLHADLCLYTALLGLAVGNLHGLEHLCCRREVDGQGDDASVGDGDGLGVFLVAHEAHPQGVVAGGHLVDEEETVEVGGATIGGAVEHHICKGDGLAVALVEQHALYGALSRCRNEK